MTVPSDGEFHGVPLTAREARARRRFVVVPRESTDVFRVVELDNPLDGPLLPGPIDVYRGAEFTMTAEVASTPPRGRLTLGLGVEQAIKVARNTRFREDARGLLGGGLALEHDITVEIVNHLPVAADVEVRERIPVAAEEQKDDIEVEVTRAQPAWERWDPTPADAPVRLRGGYRWRTEVGAGGRAELSAGYVVQISAKQELVGGNRREG